LLLAIEHYEETNMRGLIVLAGAVALFGSAAVADEVIVAPQPGTVVEHRAADENTTTSKTVRHDADGCATKSVTHSNQDTGSSVTHTKSNC
jgi:hypothetical protein